VFFPDGVSETLIRRNGSGAGDEREAGAEAPVAHLISADEPRMPDTGIGSESGGAGKSAALAEMVGGLVCTSARRADDPHRSTAL